MPPGDHQGPAVADPGSHEAVVLRLRLDVLRQLVAEAEAALAARGLPAPSPPMLVHRDTAVAGPIVSLQQAAGAVGWRPERVVRAIRRHNAANPEDPIGWQAGGNPRARWEIPLGRLRRYVQHCG